MDEEGAIGLGRRENGDGGSAGAWAEERGAVSPPLTIHLSVHPLRAEQTHHHPTTEECLVTEINK